MVACLRLISPVSRVQPAAWISNSLSKSATALERQGETGSPLTASGKVRREVPLPSQEKKEGAMQYALYVQLRVFGFYHFLYS